MTTRIRIAIPLALATLSGLHAPSETAGAPRAPHEAGALHEAVLTLGSSTAAAGGTLRVTGAEFHSVTTYTLVLKGVLDEYEVGSAESDSEGRFTLELEIPDNVRPGAYRLVALEADGEEAASRDLTVESAPADVDVESGEASPGDADANPMPRADELVIERRWSGFEWFVIGAALIGALAAGSLFYRGKAGHRA